MNILPTVMPDEFAPGYLGRIHILNLLGKPNQTLKALIDYFALQPSRIRRIEALAFAAKTSTQLFVQNHTLIPANSAISENLGGVCHGHPKYGALFSHSWNHLQKSGVYFCPQCVDEQRGCLGFSYWQRLNQLRGVSWCSKHFCPLLGCPENSLTIATPNVDLATNAAPEIEPEEPYWPVVKRYSEIMHGFLRRGFRAGRSDVARTIRAVAARQAIYMGTNNGCDLLSDIAVSQLPAWWLKELFPSIHTKQLGVPFLPFDNTLLNDHAQPHAFALAMALLYRSSKKALVDMP
ncbi:TniQ family protein [Dechloromonas denitrificans]|uniref:TniQ family protein n=1 Tax=Dechloromonas denitrificans TaxID=281362 RepID=UPI001CFAA703|nr:TniQ family protein [Dechloromonas denitrificans]UCV08535.1 TniQ family protein [Dechloromonas denitrificans]